MRDALASEKGLLIRPAAELIRTLELDGYEAPLGAAFRSLLEDPVKRDPGCAGKLAVMKAFLTVGGGDSSLYLAGARHVQREPEFDGNATVLVDRAAGVRGNAGLALYRTGHPDGPVVLAELLADPELEARILAAHALAEVERHAAVPLLRYKLAIGDAEPEVVGACAGALLAADPDLGLAVARKMLGGAPGPAAESIAVALGESKKPAVFEVLRTHAEAVGAAGRATAYLAIALLRDGAATQWLVGVVKDGLAAHATAAVHALSHYRHDPRIREPALAAAKERNDAIRALAIAELGRD